MVNNMKLTRNEFLKTIGYTSAAAMSGSVLASSANAGSGEGAQSSSAGKSKADIMLGVSLYSYQHAIYTHAMTLEDCLAELNSIGAQGLQIIDEITIPDFPNPSERWVDTWFSMVDKYKLTPTNMNCFVDVWWGWRHKAMDLQEQVATLTTRLKIAKKLGFTVVRPTSGSVSEPVGKLFESIVPIAEDLDMRVTPELHAPIPLQTNKAFVGGIMETILKKNTKHLGFTLDMGDLPLPFSKERSIKFGEMSEKIASYIEESKAKGIAIEDVLSKIPSMGSKQADVSYAYRVYGISPTQGMGMMGNFENNPKDILPLLPYIYNIHGKFYKMTEDLVETTLNYEGAFKVLVEGGYTGSIDSEYEGQRNLQAQWCEPINEVEQVRRHHLMMRRLLGRI
jgi:hypothetical protein